MNPCTIILAAGKGTRLKSEKPKVMHEILGLPLVFYPINLARKLGSSIIAVTGHGREVVGPYLDTFSITQTVQDPPLGTGHAVMTARDAIRQTPAEDVIIIPGDMPLIEYSSLTALIELYRTHKVTLGILTARLSDPSGYGRIIRDGNDYVMSIIEHNDANDEQKKINEINTGVYIIRKDFLLNAVERLTPNNAKGEYYLTDIVHMADSAVSFVAPDYNEAHGINSREQLSHAARIMQLRVNKALMEGGVTFIEPGAAWISPLVAMGRDVEIWKNVHVLGESSIASKVTIILTSVKDRESAITASLRTVPSNPAPRSGQTPVSDKIFGWIDKHVSRTYDSYYGLDQEYLYPQPGDQTGAGGGISRDPARAAAQGRGPSARRPAPPHRIEPCFHSPGPGAF